MQLEDLCKKYQIEARLGMITALGPGPVIGLAGFGGRLCQTAFTEKDWAGEPIEAPRVIVVCFTELLSYWTMERGGRYLPFTSQHDLELNEVRKLDSQIRLFLGPKLKTFIAAAWPHLHVPRYLRDSLRACVQLESGQRDAWRYRPKPEIKGHPEVRLSTFGEEEEISD